MHNLSLFAVPGFVAQMLMYANVTNAGGADESRNITRFYFSLLVHLYSTDTYKINLLYNRLNYE